MTPVKGIHTFFYSYAENWRYLLLDEYTIFQDKNILYSNFSYDSPYLEINSPYQIVKEIIVYPYIHYIDSAKKV
jgi:hypothetical protein